MRGNQSNALKFEPVFKETLQLHPIGLVVNACKRLQRDLVLAEIEVLSAECLGQNKRRVTRVEEEDLAVWNCAEVCRDRSERNALAAPGRVVDAGMARVADMQVEPERRAARCRAIAKRGRVLGIVGARIHREPWPDTCQRQDVGEVLSVDQRPAHVIPTVPWQRTKPRLNCIYRFDPRVESHVLANLEHELRVLIRNVSLVLGDNHFWSDVAVSDRSSLGLCDRLVGVSRHLECMLVLKGCAGAGTEVLANDAAKSEPLLEPVPSVDGELAYRGSWPDWNSTDRVAITDGSSLRNAAISANEKGGKPDRATTRMCLPPTRGLNPAIRS